jgi:AAA15 family ATPase/GTPase
VIRELTIQNYKSILDHKIELGRINVFIGENGCGKTNILEAMAMAAATLTDKLSVEELFARGIRVAKPAIMRSSFEESKSLAILLSLTFTIITPRNSPRDYSVPLKLSHATKSDVTFTETGRKSLTSRLGGIVEAERQVKTFLDLANAAQSDPAARNTLVDFIIEAKDNFNSVAALAIYDEGRSLLSAQMSDFAIYNANILALRGLYTFSRRTPLGIYGENLDVAMSALPSDVWADVLERAKCVSWLEDIVVDPEDSRKYEGHKLGQSKSNLYFHDRFMKRRNNVFSAENVNEGILHVLFYLTLFVSESAPKVFGIDNIDTALNPQLCRDLMKQLAELAAKHDKQALITTHNPAVLDGMNLLDDEQRLFVVYRDDDGHTVTRRIKQKPETKEGKYKLSELWMRGLLGGLPPERF